MTQLVLDFKRPLKRSNLSVKVAQMAITMANLNSGTGNEENNRMNLR